jgi:uncharacterized protein (DUF2336 family)
LIGTTVVNAYQSLLAELEDLIRCEAPEKRAGTLRRITDFLLTGIAFFTDEQIDLFDDVLLRLIDEIEITVLAELASNLAPIDRAPIHVVRQMARHDEIMVAGPILTGSNRLDAADLIEVAETRTQEHLLAISVRRRLEAAVTDVLVSRGNEDVLLSVARNEDAALSEAGFATLVTRAESDELTETVGRRSDIPPDLLERLLLRATRIVRGRLLDSARSHGRPEVARVLGKVAREIGIHEGLHRYDAAEHLVASKQDAGTLGEATVLEFATANKLEEVIVALSILCSVSVDVIDRLMDSERSEAMLVPCRAAGLGWTTVREIIRVHARGRQISEDSLRRSRTNYDKLSPTAAARILRFWQSRLAGSHRPADAERTVAEMPAVMATSR